MKIEEMIEQLQEVAKNHPGIEVAYDTHDRYLPCDEVEYERDFNQVIIS